MSRSTTIASLNDDLRRSLTGGRIYKTNGIDALDPNVQAKILEAVRAFGAFTDGNDPYGEHDFGAVDVEGHRCFWKIDYYDRRDMGVGANDPADANTTERVLTIMLAEEY